MPDMPSVAPCIAINTTYHPFITVPLDLPMLVSTSAAQSLLHILTGHSCTVLQQDLYDGAACLQYCVDDTGLGYDMAYRFVPGGNYATITDVSVRPNVANDRPEAYVAAGKQSAFSAAYNSRWSFERMLSLVGISHDDWMAMDDGAQVECTRLYERLTDVDPYDRETVKAYNDNVIRQILAEYLPLITHDPDKSHIELCTAEAEPER